jgi:hypothetical protein
MGRYNVIVHAVAPREDAEATDRLCAALEAEGVEIVELRTEDDPHGTLVFHIEAALDAPSAYHLEQFSGKVVFGEALERAGIGTMPDVGRAIAIAATADAG